MGSDFGFVGARVCEIDGQIHQSNVISGTCATYGSLTSRKKQDTEFCRNSYFVPSSMKEYSPRGQDRGMANGSIALITGSEGKSQRRVEKVPKYISGSFKKLRMVETYTALPLVENDGSNMELDMLGSHLVKCSDADKSQVVKQRNNSNCRRGDKRNSKATLKAKFDPFSLKAVLPSFKPVGGGNNAFGMYGLKPDVHDVTKLMGNISVNELLDRFYKCPTFGKDKEKRTANVNDNVIDSVRKVCSRTCLLESQRSKQTEEVDTHAIKDTPSSSSPSHIIVENCAHGDGNTIADLPECSKDLDPSIKGEVFTDFNGNPLDQPRDILEKLALPRTRSLESLLQDTGKPAKQFSHRVGLPPFPWSHNVNGHYKSNNDALKTSSKSPCLARWVKISNSASFIQRRVEGIVDLDSIAYDDSLVPAGQHKYKLPEVDKFSTTSISQHLHQQDVSPVSHQPAPLPPPALPSPKVLSAARTLYSMASCPYAMTSSPKHNSVGLLKWPKRQSQKAMKAPRSRLNEIPEEGFWVPKSETIPGDLVRNMEYGSSSKEPKISRVDRREEYSHVQAVIGLCSVSALRSNRSSPNISSRDSLSEAKYLNGSLEKSSFMGPPPPRIVDRVNQNPQKSRKFTSIG